MILDADLAALYDVATKKLLQAVRRNAERFPSDFMFVLSPAEFAALRAQAPPANGRGGRRHRPFAFTEHGVAMLSSVLRSRRAVQVNIAIVREFIRLRRQAGENQTLATKLDELEKRYDKQFKCVFDALRLLMRPPAPGARRIGF